MSEFRYRDVPSSPESNEAEHGPQTEVVVHFLRHEDKESKPPEGAKESDIELTTAGRRHALETAREKPAGIGIAAGSERVRSGHTALLRLEGAKGLLTEEMTAADAKAAVDSELKVGSKLTQMPELTFAYQGSPEYNEQFMAQFKGGHALEFILHKSDDVVREAKDESSLSYSRTAANYASVIAREWRVSRAFHGIVGQNPEKYASVGNRIERYFGTHQTVPESFYMKVLEKTQGRPTAEKFIDLLRDPDGKTNGFGFQEGIDVRMTHGPDGERVAISSVRGLPEIELTPQLLDEIIGDAEQLNADVDQARRAEAEAA